MARHAPHGSYDYPHDDVWCEEFTPPRRTHRQTTPDQKLDDLLFRLDYLERAVRQLYGVVRELSQRPRPADPSPPFQGTTDDA